MLKYHVEFYNRCSATFITSQLNLKTSDSFERKTMRKAFIVLNCNCTATVLFLLLLVSEYHVWFHRDTDRTLWDSTDWVHVNNFVSGFVSPTEFCFHVKLKSTRFLKWNQTGNSIFVIYGDKNNFKLYNLNGFHNLNQVCSKHSLIFLKFCWSLLKFIDVLWRTSKYVKLLNLFS